MKTREEAAQYSELCTAVKDALGDEVGVHLLFFFAI